ncbi:SAM-dependent methyltransferase [bacterium]|nr:SAM-dependent methyltransferase [bacterium]
MSGEICRQSGGVERGPNSKDPLRRLLVKQFGAKSSFAKIMIPELEKLASRVPATFQAFIPAVGLTSANDIVGRRSYVALLSRSILLQSTRRKSVSEVHWRSGLPLPDWSWLEIEPFDQFHQAMDTEVKIWLRTQQSQPLIDPFLTLQHNLIPSVWRKRWGEFYTPEWLADLVVRSVWKSDLRWLDPTAGAGAFALAVARQAVAHRDVFPEFVAFERDPWSLLSAASTIALGRWWANASDSPISVGQVDVIERKARFDSISSFERVVGNPPWILWDLFPSNDRAAMLDCWREYGLQMETGMASILGGGKRDYSFLVLLKVAHHWLADRGQLSFVLPQSAFKSTTSGRGLRRWRLPDETPLCVDRVDDLSRFQPFAGATVKTVVARVTKGLTTTYPVSYRVWSSANETDAVLHWARPSDASDELSGWHHQDGTESEWFECLSGSCAYEAHLGVNTGGAAGVYWLTKLGEENGLWRMANLADRGKKKVAPVEALLEPDHLYPALLGKDVAPWRAEPSAWLLMVQDVSRRRGLDEEYLQDKTPRTFAYLKSFESTLRGRAAQKRYFSKPTKGGEAIDTGPFYSMFNVGSYTLAPIKVVWNRMGNRLAAAVISQREGKLVLPQETHCFFGVDSWDEGDFVAALLNSDWTQRFLERLSPNSSKSFGTPRVMHQIRIGRFDPTRKIDRELSALGRKAREASAATNSIEPSLKVALDLASAAYWEIPRFLS